MSVRVVDDALVGRDAELDELREGLEALRQGRGHVWLLAGEPGIGKSALAERIAQEATAVDIAVHWGRCWEAGGAPAYWPWIQVLRDAFEASAEAPALPADHEARLAQWMPELRRGAPQAPELPPLGAEQARFELLDAASATLRVLARERPLLLVLEDLHVADESSLVLLEFLTHQVRGAPVAVLGTYRDEEADAGASGSLLARVARAARTLALGRLGRDHVREYLVASLGEELAHSLAGPLHERTEGHPLFLLESLRLVERSRDGVAPEEAAVAATRAAFAIPARVRSAIGDRIDGLPGGTRAIIAAAAVVGREFRRETLGALCDADPRAIDEALELAAELGILVPLAERRWRFSHILYREVLHDAFDEAEREGLHGRLARYLEECRARGDQLPWSVIALHHGLAGDGHRGHAVDAHVCAAEAALEQSAFEEAISAYRRAIALADPDEPRRTAELTLGLGRARLRAGDSEGGRQSCQEVVQRARALGEGELLARAALEIGSIFVFVVVDGSLVALLREALDQLDAGDSSLRARVMARLAAAMQPADDTRIPIALAGEAVEMARRVGDRRTLLETLRAAGSCMMDLADPGERIALDQEYLEGALLLERDVDILRAATRVAVDRFELGDLPRARAAIDEARGAAERLGHPHFRWRAVAFTATLALWEGRLDEAEEAIEQAREMGERGSDSNARATYLFQRSRLDHLRGDVDHLVVTATSLGELFAGTPVGEASSGIPMCAYLVRAGRVDEARERLDPPWIEGTLAGGDRTLFDALAELAHAWQDDALAGRIEEALAELPDRFVASGVVGMTWESHMARVRGRVALVRGRRDEGIAQLETSLSRVREAGGMPTFAEHAVELARELRARGESEDMARAVELIEEAGAAARRCGMAGLLRSIEALGAAEPAPPAAPSLDDGAPAVHLERCGEGWTLRRGPSEIRLRDAKGLRLLAVLVERPGEEVHVLDLEQAASGGEGVVDTGDAGEQLDERAIGAYRERAQELRAELEEAEQWNDAGRVDRLREELEVLTRELSRGVGLGGRARRAGAASERARVNVQRRIKATIRRIAEDDAALAKHLDRSVRTGNFCSYEP